MTGVDVDEVRTDVVGGRLFCPRDMSGPAIVAMGGSEGGLPAHMARLLAAEGYCCLALGYFGAAGLPRHLVNVPLDYVEAAIDWLRAQPQVDGDRIGVIGASKGAELALLSAARFPQAIAVVVAYAPSCVAFAGISFGAEGRRKSSWSYQGEPLPFVPYPRRNRPALGFRGLSLVPMYQRALDEADRDVVASAAIPIERSDASIMLVSGGRDQMWPSAAMAENLVDRLTAADKADRVEHLHFPDAGHSFMPWEPDLNSRLAVRAINGARLAGFGGLFALGGRSSANRQALVQAWTRSVAFLRQHLPPAGLSTNPSADA